MMTSKVYFVGLSFFIFLLMTVSDGIGQVTQTANEPGGDSSAFQSTITPSNSTLITVTPTPGASVNLPEAPMPDLLMKKASAIDISTTSNISAPNQNAVSPKPPALELPEPPLPKLQKNKENHKPQHAKTNQSKKKTKPLPTATPDVLQQFINEKPENVSLQGEVLRVGVSSELCETKMINLLIALFEKKYSTLVEPICQESSASLDLFMKGKLAAMITNWQPEIAQATSSGIALSSRKIISDPFLLVGPKEDPAKIAKISDVDIALRKIYLVKAPFVSRADDSGDCLMEKEIWQRANVVPKGNWYIEAKSGMQDALVLAYKKRAYLIVNQSLFLAYSQKGKFSVFIENAPLMANEYYILVPNPEKFPQVNCQGGGAVRHIFFRR